MKKINIYKWNVEIINKYFIYQKLLIWKIIKLYSKNTNKLVKTIYKILKIHIKWNYNTLEKLR
jgi:hypothetical protein